MIFFISWYHHFIGYLISTNLRTFYYAFWEQTTKIETHEFKLFNSITIIWVIYQIDHKFWSLIFCSKMTIWDQSVSSKLPRNLCCRYRIETSTFAITAYRHHTNNCVFASCSCRCVLDTTLCQLLAEEERFS
jgi:hypothetical protein